MGLTESFENDPSLHTHQQTKAKPTVTSKPKHIKAIVTSKATTKPKHQTHITTTHYDQRPEVSLPFISAQAHYSGISPQDKPWNSLPIDHIVSIQLCQQGAIASHCSLDTTPNEQHIVQDWTSQSWNRSEILDISLLLDKQTKYTVASGKKATEIYTEACQEQDEDSYIYFQSSDTYLHSKQHLKNDFSVVASDGESTIYLHQLVTKSLLTVMCSSISSINHTSQLKNASSMDVGGMNVFWIITISPTWDKASVDLMRRCAGSANMKYFELCFSPIAALSNRLNPYRHDYNKCAKELKLVPNNKILVLDFGDDKTDATVVAIDSNCKVVSNDRLSKGYSDVDEEFMKLLARLLPSDIIDSVQCDSSQWNQQKAAFSAAKQKVPLRIQEPYCVKFCEKIKTMLKYKRENRQKDLSYIQIKSHIKRFIIRDVNNHGTLSGVFALSAFDDCLKITKKGWQYLFEPAFSHITQFLQKQFDEIALCGNFAQNLYLLSVLSKTFPDKKFLKTVTPHRAVVKGALHWICSRNEPVDVDNDSKCHDIDDEYKIDKYVVSKALVLIICISEYDEPWDRLPGSNIDKNNMIDLWKEKYGYDILFNENGRVDQSDCFVKLAECRNILSMKQDQNKYDALFVIFSGHGTANSIRCSDGKLIGRSRIVRWFNGENVPFMSNKPKIMMFDACRGNTIAIPIASVHRPVVLRGSQNQ
eukprot:110824_1